MQALNELHHYGFFLVLTISHILSFTSANSNVVYIMKLSLVIPKDRPMHCEEKNQHKA